MNQDTFRMNKWYDAMEGDLSVQSVVDVCVGGQVCLIRNLAAYPFADRMNEELQKHLLEDVSYAVKEAELSLGLKFGFCRLSNLKAYERQALVNRLSVPPQMLLEDHEMGLFRSEDETVCILAGGKEHICIQISMPGFSIQQAYNLAVRVEDELNNHLVYAYHHRYGYLTANPFYTGTGMIASYLLHVPFLEEKKMISQFEKAISQYGFSLRPHFAGEGLAPGCIYRIRNRKTLGISEQEVLSALEQLTMRIIDQERILTRQMKESRDQSTVCELDRICRAYGILKYARLMNYEDSMCLLSSLRTGLISGLITFDRPVSIFGLMLEMSDVAVCDHHGSMLCSHDRQVNRAAFLKTALSELRSDYID